MSPSKQERLFPKAYAAELLLIARGDLRDAEILAAAKVDRKVNVIYLAQQALEKALKAVLCHGGQAVPLVHDIGVLIAKLPAEPPPPFGYELSKLTEFAAIRRYIAGSEAVDDEEVAATIAAVKAAIAWCGDVVEATP